MKRKPYFQKKEDFPPLPEAQDVLVTSKWPKWLTTEQTAIYLGKFRKRDGKPSVGAIRNMIYRKQLQAKNFFGRILVNRLELDLLISHSPLAGGN